MHVKKQELDLRKQEQEQIIEAQNQQRDMFKQMIKQQQEQQRQMQDIHSFLMLQQQHQLTTALMKVTETLVPKQKKLHFALIPSGISLLCCY